MLEETDSAFWVGMVAFTYGLPLLHYIAFFGSAGRSFEQALDYRTVIGSGCFGIRRACRFHQSRVGYALPHLDLRLADRLRICDLCSRSSGDLA